MNPEAKKIITKMQEYVSESDLSPPGKQLKVTIDSSRILVIVAEEQAKAAERVERQTNKLIGLTWALVGLTVGLLILTLVIVFCNR